MKGIRVIRLMLVATLVTALIVTPAVWAGAKDTQAAKADTAVKKEAAEATGNKKAAEVKGKPAVAKLSRAQGRAAKERSKIIEEAVTALAKTNLALRDLDAGNKDKAIQDLAVVVGKLEVIMARDPKLSLAPVDVQVITHDLYSTVKDINKAVAKAKKLLQEGRVQDARAILSGLGSEVIIRVTNIPLATYPGAIKAVVPLIDKGKVKEAKAALEQVLSTLVIVDHIIPLPVLRAEFMLQQAAKLAKKEKRTTAESKKLAKLLKDARVQLNMAEALGYGDVRAYKPFYDAILAIQKKTSGGGTETGLFKTLRPHFQEFWSKI
jgi:CRISPR/Cas system CSM-associated protein Csm2 small subunit